MAGPGGTRQKYLDRVLKAVLLTTFSCTPPAAVCATCFCDTGHPCLKDWTSSPKLSMKCAFHLTHASSSIAKAKAPGSVTIKVSCPGSRSIDQIYDELVP